jgi:uncharacterized protein with PQ loop repeat
MRFSPLHLSRKAEVRAVDRAMDVVSIIHPATALPQVWSIYTTHNVSGISLLTWLLFMAIGLVFLAYGILHRIKPLILMQVLWFVVDGLVVLGVLLYG